MTRLDLFQIKSALPALIVGAGPSGLAVGHHLQRLGVDFLMLERFQVGASWAQYYDTLQLHTRKPNVALPGLPLLAQVPDFPSGNEYFEYLQSYAKHFNLPVQEGVEVLSVRRGKDGWHVKTNAGELETLNLIVASGIFGHPKRPSLPGEESFGGEIFLARDYHNPEPFLGKRVLVVGVGNTGVGIALSLAAAGVSVGVAVREGVQFVPLPGNALATRSLAKLMDELPPTLSNALLKLVRKDFKELDLPTPNKRPLEVTPVVGYELVDKVRAKRVKVQPGIKTLTKTGVQFVNGEVSNYDALILATGYAPTLDFLPRIELDKRGRPTPAQAGLYTIGFHYPTTKPFLLEMKSEAERVAKQVAQKLEAA